MEPPRTSAPKKPPASGWGIFGFIKRFSLLNLFQETVRASLNSKIPRMGAAISYYTLFSVAPLFVIALAIAGFCFGPEAARRELFGQLSGLVGHDGSETLQAMVAAAGRPRSGAMATCFAVGTLIVGATGVFVELQDSLNTIWNVQNVTRHGLWGFLRNRVLSFAMVLGIGFLLLVSLILSAVLSALGNFVTGLIPAWRLLSISTNFLVSLALITVLFAMIFKMLPDAKIAWRDVWMGGLMTALLFNLGKFLLGFYLGRSSFASVYGAAGSVLAVLLWVYYSAQILLFGAKFTQLYAEKHGSRIGAGFPPAPGPGRNSTPPSRS